jgi:hypothetical protein
MTVRQIIELVNNGTITNLDTEIVICTNDNYLEIDPEYWDLGEYGLDNDHIYERINTEQSILKLYEKTS